MKKILRGDILYIDLGQHPKSSVQSGKRPCVVVSNNKNNEYAAVINVCPFTTKTDKNHIPVHVLVKPEDVEGYFEAISLFMAEQIVTVDKRNIVSKAGHIDCDSKVMRQMEEAIKKQLGLNK